MSEDNVILKVENLSKQYRLGLVGTGTISHDLNRFFAKIRGKEDPYLKVGESNDRATKGNSEYVWALKDINFEVKKGEVLGIIGKNGAGKSTLLKILSKVTGPTTGVIKSKGRIASLLEVGTGFHPEMTGKENIFLNGAILGMTKKEIQSKLDEIVSFSGCERYIDTPVKRYSSGMKVRLAFAVAAHLEPDILIVDEVLAVGDAEFQKKAIGKMQDISNTNGRTVLFVSHDMAAIQTLCEKTILLENGKISGIGKSNKIIKSYLSKSKGLISNSIVFENPKIIEEIKICNENKIYSGEEFDFSVIIDSTKLDYITLGYLISDEKGNNIHAANMQQYDLKFKTTQEKKEIKVNLNNLPLIPGNYYLSIYLGNGSYDVEIKKEVIYFSVSWIENSNFLKPNEKWGVVYTKTNWKY